MLDRGSLELEQRWVSSWLSAATWLERSSINCRSALVSGNGETLASAEDAVCTVGRNFQIALDLTGENGLYFGG